jgi:transposase, IS30 family
MTDKTMQYLTFTRAERDAIELLLLGKWSMRDIAESLGRDHSAVSREVRRNTPGGAARYRADKAEKMAAARASRPRRKRMDDRALASWVEGRIRDGWSPERAAGRLKSAEAPPSVGGKTACHETIYAWIYRGGRASCGLTDFLWSRRRRRWARKGRKPRGAQIRGRTPVCERPDDGAVGHFETDSMVWSGWRGLLSVQVERESLRVTLTPCADRKAASTLDALRRCAETQPLGLRPLDFTFDNGGEGALHLALREEYGVGTYFCAPHSPWQKPLVENMNRTIRHRHPRKTKASALTDRDWKGLEDWMNSLPRKSLGYLTPDEYLKQRLAAGAALT